MNAIARPCFNATHSTWTKPLRALRRRIVRNAMRRTISYLEDPALQAAMLSRQNMSDILRRD
jgi:hypothetical protein